VIHPPVEPKPASPGGPRQDFLLSLGRLVHYKRVDLAIAAARLAGVPLVIAGDGPDRRRLERLAGPDVRFVGEVSEAEAGRLLETCRAFVFCAEEDFGITPVEANAHGAPVVAYAQGGALESLLPGVTAEFFDTLDPRAAADAIRRALARDWDPVALRGHARQFAPERFRREFATALEAILESKGLKTHDGA
jgi:glycosyltransferase involved in cell wall biosynthesis